MTTRRSFIASATLTGALTAATTPTPAATEHMAMSKPSLPDLSFSKREPFLDRERAQRILAEEGLEALIVGEGRNVFHATNFFPLLERMSMVASAIAVIPRDPKRPVSLIIPSFSYYYIQADDGLVPGVEPVVFTTPASFEMDRGENFGAEAARPLLYRLDGEAPAREVRRRKALEDAAPYHASLERALAHTLKNLGITNGRVGYDHVQVARTLSRAMPSVTAVAADDTPRRIRLVRTPAEIRMMRLASEANIAAAHATIAKARELGSTRAFRQAFFAEAALRGNLGVFMVVNASSSEAYDEPLRDGQAFLIDCVSQLRNFHGDYGRTVFVGEPTKRMRHCTSAMSDTWNELQSLIRPGLRFSEVRELGSSILKKFSVDVPVAFSPHSVGLAHTDQPRLDSKGERADIVIEENMILSIDCPLFETGEGGTAHLEDLILVTPRGGVPIHDVGTPTYIV